LTSARSLAVIVLAAGQGTRMKSPLPKVLHPVGGRPILGAILDAVAGLAPARTVVVTGPAQPTVAAFATSRGAVTAIQDPPRGTGHAAQCALPALEGFAGDVLILYGDTPLLTPETLTGLVAAKGQAALALLGFTPADPGQYGRLILDADGTLLRIVEAKDANAAERAVRLCNAGGFVLDAALLRELLAGLTADNAQGEYYLTDLVGGVRAKELTAVAYDAPVDDVMGVNSQAELAAAEAVFQQRARLAHMAAGVSLADPATTYFSADTTIGPGTTIGPNVVLAPGVKIAANVTIKPFCHLEGVTIASGAIIGPFARLRPGSEIGEDVHIGNFVETKAAKLDKGAKANHLTYLGDVSVGAGANIGAGTITCNYDGFFKYRTEIGAGAFIGSNTSLVAPVSVGDNANVGAGSVITKNVAPDALALTRAPQADKPGWAARFRSMMGARKAAAARKD
jgi:bifunctional UDP-N-acetylglucosamine pyrophosphorylase/glucosamine-1-phosphate N-acetyltransferase